MVTCKDCIHYDVCKMWAMNIEEYNVKLTPCKCLKNKADVVEIKHAYWEPIISYFHGKPTGKYYCTNCRRVETRRSFYCPDCGAKMEVKSRI